MIKINLLRNISGGAGPQLGTSISASPMELSKEAQKQLGIRLMVILGAVGLLWFYESNELNAKRESLDTVRREIQEVQAKKNQYGDAAPIVEKYTKQKEALDLQIKVLESVTVNRLREVKLLDALQSLLPQKAWLESVVVERGEVTISGYAPDAETVNYLFRQLENNVLFSNVQQKINVDKDVPELGLLREFQFSFVAGRPEKP